VKVAVLLAEGLGASGARAVAEQLGASAVVGVGLGAAEGPLRAAAAGLGLPQLAAVVDPALARVGPRQSGQVLAALLNREQASLLLIDAEADRGDGMLAAAAAHHFPAALLLGAERISRAASGDAVEVTLPLAGRRFQLQVSLPAVIVLAAGAGPAASATAVAPDGVQAVVHGLEALSLQPRDLIEPAPPSTARPGQTRPTPVKDLSSLLGR
jgi:hypothetical protein